MGPITRGRRRKEQVNIMAVNNQVTQAANKMHADFVEINERFATATSAIKAMAAECQMAYMQLVTGVNSLGLLDTDINKLPVIHVGACGYDAKLTIHVDDAIGVIELDNIDARWLDALIEQSMTAKQELEKNEQEQ